MKKENTGPSMSLPKQFYTIQYTLLWTRDQSCLWDYHINLTEKNVNGFEQFWVGICLKTQKFSNFH
jgi:hypothetical protein